MNYFATITTKADLQRRYRDLCRELHPDTGGSAEEFVAMKQEYDELQTTLKHRPDYFRLKKKIDAERQAMQPKPNPPATKKQGSISTQERRFRAAGKAFTVAAGAYLGAIIGDAIFEENQ